MSNQPNNEENNMPERIWAGDFNAEGYGHCVAGMQGGLYAEYIRADLVEELLMDAAFKLAQKSYNPGVDTPKSPG